MVSLRKFSLAEEITALSESPKITKMDLELSRLTKEQREDLLEIKKRYKSGTIKVPKVQIRKKCVQAFDLDIGITAFKNWLDS